MTTELAIKGTSLTELATQMFNSKLFPDLQSAAQAVVKIQAGRELGVPPVYAMTKIYIIKGKVSISAELMASKIKSSGRYDYKVTTLTDYLCELQFTDNQNDCYSSKFTIDEAKRAGVYADGGGWQKWPRAMLFARALSQGARIVCPNVIGGAYVPEELGAVVDEDGVPTAVTATIEAPPDLPKDEPITPEQLKRIGELKDSYNLNTVLADLDIHVKSAKEMTKAQANALINSLVPADKR